MSFWNPRPVLVAGPCVLQDGTTNLAIAERVAEIAENLGVRFIFKASFDKANRTNAGAARGPGLAAGLGLLAQVKQTLGIPVLTDVHEVWQVEETIAVVDALQVPAFLCRQTDLLQAVGTSGIPVNIKKGQWMPPEAMAGAVEKVRRANGMDIAVTERGTFFGYGDLVVDMRNFRRLRNVTSATVLFDVTHSLQRPGLGRAGSSGGNREFAGDLARAAAAAGADGFFLETHPNPKEAASDSETMIPLDELSGLLEEALDSWHAAAEKRVH